MKRILLAALATGIVITSFAQTDSTNVQTDSTKIEREDTIRVGGMVIIRKGDKSDVWKNEEIKISNWKKGPFRSNTNWGVLDIGFANYNDKSNYEAAAASDFVQEGVTEDDLKARTGKSVNVNLWFFMQRLNLIKKVVYLKYGLGLELNNYHFDNKTVRFLEDPTKIILDESLKGIKKSKLAADYVTIPMMLNFNFTPNSKQSFGFSAGVSAGYLYSSRHKIKYDDEKNKIHDDFNLRDWKISYIGEINLGVVRLYGSYATQNMWDKGLDQTPYTVGLRFSYF
ncbi:PorT family protein [Chitinophagaceae bacterium LB-8]|uniref:PorT family protein n=1 Tax=Paraflavisolibacter caeni TaxID=2982496 RepID=A0A9X2Y025_9BACT|nr:outer membrane beta-barrel protein [Paraflavisolibacter caeni]MCU7552055.1 PorT family protein [Paraflavisolibacter caeni]